jgi:hypothetical protein
MLALRNQLTISLKARSKDSNKYFTLLALASVATGANWYYQHLRK